MRHSLTLFVLLMGADVGITLLALQHGLAQEGNPLGRAYYAIGPWFMVAIKVVAVLITVGICWILRNYKPARAYVWFANVAMAFVVVHNALTILPAMGGLKP